MDIKVCQMCGEVNKTTGKYCNTCYGYLRRHPEGTYTIPPVGEIVYAPNGDPICHICGQAHRKLGNHIAYKHNMTQNEYRDVFKLYHNTKLSNVEYRSTMSAYIDVYKDIVVNKNLIEKGKDTRMSTDYNTPGRRMQHKIKESTIK